MHDHWRLDELMESLAPHQSLCEYSVVMPNLPEEPVLGSLRKNWYLATLRQSFQGGGPGLLMTCQLTPETPLDEIEHSSERGVFAWKGYSRNVTTNSDYGIEEWDSPEMHARAVVAGRVGVPFLLHLQDKTPDPLDGELSALHRALPLIEAHRNVIWSVEHATCAKTIEVIRSLRKDGFSITTTLTLHGATKCVDDVGDNPYLKVQPPIQSAANRDAVLDAILSGEFIKGRDAAAHPYKLKQLGWEKAPSGIWTPDCVDIPLTYQLFKEHGGPGWESRFAKFMMGNAHAFYGSRMPMRLLPLLRLVQEDWVVEVETSPIKITPFRAGEVLRYRLAG